MPSEFWRLFAMSRIVTLKALPDRVLFVDDNPSLRRFARCIWCTQPIEIERDVCGFCGRSQWRIRRSLLLVSFVLTVTAIGLWVWLRP